MIIIEQSWSWEQKPSAESLALIERAGRTCYKSEDKITPESAPTFAAMVLGRGHESVIEHAGATVRIVTDRGVTHELVRHRLAAYSQESTRYCNYGGNHIQFIRPVWVDWSGIYPPYEPITVEAFLNEDLDDLPADSAWVRAMLDSERSYNHLLDEGWRPEQARSVLPNSLKTEIVMTANLREWRHVFRLRAAKAAHPQMRELMQDMLAGFRAAVPVIFDDIHPN